MSVIASYCLSKLRSLEANIVTSEVKGKQIVNLSVNKTFTDALCNWGRGEEILEMISEWLEKGRRIRELCIGTVTTDLSLSFFIFLRLGVRLRTDST